MDDPERAVRKAVAIGDRLAEAGDMRRARAAYRRVIESGNPEWAPHAAIKLGDLFAAYGARSLVLSSYKHAINAQSDEWSHQGWLKIRALLSPDGDRVDDHGDPATLLTEVCLRPGNNQLWAIDRALKLMDQRARLMGINVPVRQEIRVLTETVVDKSIQDLQRRQMQAQAAEAGVELPAEA